jgi:hypothetical protein
MVDTVALGEEIAGIAGQINVATHRLLTCIRGFDEAEGWGQQGAQSCAHWLTWRIGLDPGTAREKVRVARALGALPKIDEAFAAGTLSYAKVRAITRIATVENEDRVLEVALAATGAQLERICRGFATAMEADVQQGLERRVRARVLGSGLVKLEVVVTADEADLFVRAIEKARNDLAGPAEPSKPAPHPSAADGLVHLASTYLAGIGDVSDLAPPDRAQLVVHVSRELTAAKPTLSASLEDGTRVSAETLRRVACDGGLVAVAVDEADGVLDVGRRTRAIPTAIRRALLLRDEGCRFPGCSNTRFLHGHHVQHWLHGGRTALDNLVLLCSFHHRLVHEGGFGIALVDTGEVEVRTPARNRLTDTPSLAPDTEGIDWDSEWRNSDLSPMFLPSWDGEPPDYGVIVGALVTG